MRFEIEDRDNCFHECRDFLESVKKGLRSFEQEHFYLRMSHNLQERVNQAIGLNGLFDDYNHPRIWGIEVRFDKTLDSDKEIEIFYKE
jgi:hypothetical protein